MSANNTTDMDVYLCYSAIFRAIDDNLDDLVRRSTSFNEANTIIENWKRANLSYLQARNKLFASATNEVKAMIKEFQNAKDVLEQSLKDLQAGNAVIGQVSQIIDEVVRKGTNLLNQT